MASLLFLHIDRLLMADNTLTAVRKGSEMREVPSLDNAWLLLENGVVKGFGGMESAPGHTDEVVDAKGRFVLPAFVDSHTHLVFATGREDEFAMRIAGKTYEEIAAASGGILNSARKLREMPEEALFDAALARLEKLRNQGTGAIEIKSGYGLTTASELKMLRVIRKLKEQSAMPIKSTFLGAHALPDQYKNDKDGYISLIIDEMLPKIATEGLADYIDVFCEQGYFTNADTDRILEAGWKFGLKPKIHVNQFTNSGGVQTGIRHKALTVDHLEVMGQAEIDALKASETLPVALPGCSFFINIPYTPARSIIDAGLPLVLASDFNPGSSPSGNMAFVMALACTQMKMTPEEALTAATINGAAAMELEHSTGSISIGKKPGIILTKPMRSLAEIPYYFGDDLVERVFY
ncbi:MAG TPA: imidazolonepropionase [Chitinophagales bacterium]|nr:imidazolonepropionase [Chitinophagales bacterium]HMX03342.1 imidazolonepropionase [Chitinophagales bacterium]HMZ89408.1 imidazolonepropionase [Chitinophagales bacterium]HNE46158.1 imidazolonepropionase [Chitinophagales bacterium]HNI54287.1 imidazolonepropionase [Chitinophagales bacterium]